jgi:hypothetical protein
LNSNGISDLKTLDSTGNISRKLSQISRHNDTSQVQLSVRSTDGHSVCACIDGEAGSALDLNLSRAIWDWEPAATWFEELDTEPARLTLVEPVVAEVSADVAWSGRSFRHQLREASACQSLGLFNQGA